MLRREILFSEVSETSVAWYSTQMGGGSAWDPTIVPEELERCTPSSNVPAVGVGENPAYET